MVPFIGGSRQMTPQSNGPGQATDFTDVQDVGWTAAQALLQAQSTGYRAMEDYMLLLYHDRIHHLEEIEIKHLLGDAIETHKEIIEDLECARDALDGQGDQ